MVSVARFHPDDLLQIDAHSDVQLCTHEYASALASQGPAFTVRDGAEVLICGGIATDKEAGIHWLWSFIARSIGRRFVAVHRIAMRFLEVHAMPLSASTRTGFHAGHRWLTMLGFTHREGQEFMIDGVSHQLYQRIA